MSTLQALMRAVQKAATPQDWSLGVELCRAGNVVPPDRAALGGEEIEVQVLGARGGAAVWVTLWPQDREWSCGCTSPKDACMHAAAAVIASHQAQLGKLTAPQQQAQPAHIHYAFTAHPFGLGLARQVVQGTQRTPLNVALAAFVRSGETKVLTQPHDVAVDTLLVSRPQGALGAPLLAKILRALRDAPHVTLDGTPVTVGGPQSEQMVALQRRPGGGVLARLRPAPKLTAAFQNGAGLFGTVLAPLTEGALPDGQRRALQQGVVFGPERQSELFGELLPRWGQMLAIDWGDVPRREEVRLAPQLHLRLSWQRGPEDTATALEVLPTVVYGAPPIARVDNGTLRALTAVVPKRLKEAEEALVRQLADALALRPGHKEQRTGAQAVALAQQIRSFAPGRAVQVDDADGALAAFSQRGALRPHLVVHETGFELSYDVPQADGTVARVGAEAVQAAFGREEPLVPLLGGGFGALPQDFLARHGDLVALLLAARAEHEGASPGSAGPSALPPWALPHLAALAEATGTALAPELAAKLRQLQATADDAAAAEQLPKTPVTTRPLPEGWVLRPYQQTGVQWLTARLRLGMGVLLADDMGLGKTLQALLSRQGRTLVVAPTSVVFNWADEVRRLEPETPLCVYHGPQRRLDPSAEITLTSYGILRQDGEALLQTPWQTVILDEAQIIKNAASQTAQAAYALGAVANSRLALTGTPVENRLDELWSQCHFLNPGMLGALSDFKRAYADPIALAAVPQIAPGSSAALQGARAAADLRRRLTPILLRRTKAQVAQDLPARTDVVLRCELTEPERAVYNSIQAATRAQVLKLLQSGGTVLQALEALLRLRQAACHTALVPGHHAPTSSKVSLLLDTLQSVLDEGHRALVFSQWTGLLDLMEPHLRAAHMTFARLDGSTPDRGQVVRHFVADDGPKIMLLSLKAGGVGLNLTAADHVFLLDPWWNPAAEDQAADRAHRIGQQRPVLVHRLVAQGTVEEQILRLQAHKRALAEAALSSDGSLMANTGAAPGGEGLTRDDLLTLLGGQAA